MSGRPDTIDSGHFLEVGSFPNVAIYSQFISSQLELKHFLPSAVNSYIMGHCNFPWSELLGSAFL